MKLDIEAALRDGFYRTIQRNALVLVAVFVAFQLGNAVVGQSLARQVYERYVDVQALFPSLNSADVAEFEATLEESFQLGLLEFSPAVLGAFFVGVFVVQMAVKIGTVRTFVSEETERLPTEKFTRRFGWALANLVVGAIVYAVLVGIGLILFVLPGIFLAVTLFFYNYEILIEDKNVFDAFQGSWELTAGNRLYLFLLGLAVGIIAYLVGWFGSIGALASPTVGLATQSVVGAAVTVFGIAVAARAYNQLQGEAETVESDEVGALGPDDLA